MISEEQDLLTSIRTVRELLDQELFFGPSTTTYGNNGTTITTNKSTDSQAVVTELMTTNNNNHWKTKFYQLKQTHYDEKLHMEAKLEQQRKEILRLQTRSDRFQQEAEIERNMRTTLETTIMDSQRNHIQTLTQQLDEVQTERTHLEDNSKTFLQVVEECQVSLFKERSTWEELLQQTRQEKDRILKQIGEEEAGRLRAEAQVKELQKAVKLQQIRIQETQNHMEKKQKQHVLEVAMTKKLMQQKIHYLQKQLKDIQTTTSKVSAVSDATVKELQLKLKDVEAQNIVLKNDLDEIKKEATEQTKAYNKLQQQYEQCEADRVKVANELEISKANVATTNQTPTSSTVPLTSTSPKPAPSTTVLTSADQVKRANLILRFETTVAQDTQLMDKLLSQIEVMTNVQPSKEGKEKELNEKKRAVNERRKDLIKKLQNFEKLLDQQLKALRHHLELATKTVEKARKVWLDCEEQFTAECSDIANQKELQMKADTAAKAFWADRQSWLAIKFEISDLSTKRSKNHNRLSALRNHENDGIIGSTTKTTTTTTKEAKSNTISEAKETRPPSVKKRANPPTTLNRQTKRQK